MDMKGFYPIANPRGFDFRNICYRRLKQGYKTLAIKPTPLPAAYFFIQLKQTSC